MSISSARKTNPCKKPISGLMHCQGLTLIMDGNVIDIQRLYHPGEPAALAGGGHAR
jgi:hypothetical protein